MAKALFTFCNLYLSVAKIEKLFEKGQSFLTPLGRHDSISKVEKLRLQKFRVCSQTNESRRWLVKKEKLTGVWRTVNFPKKSRFIFCHRRQLRVLPLHKWQPLCLGEFLKENGKQTLLLFGVCHFTTLQNSPAVFSPANLSYHHAAVDISNHLKRYRVCDFFSFTTINESQISSPLSFFNGYQKSSCCFKPRAFIFIFQSSWWFLLLARLQVYALFSRALFFVCIF